MPPMTPETLDRDGYALASGMLPAPRIDLLLDATAAAALPSGAASERRGSVYGVRNMLGVAAVRDLAASDALRGPLAPALGADPLPVRAILFDKTPGANWHVPWHQDLSIAVRERPAGDAPAGWGPWSEKAGVVHVQPPAEVLERMLTVRLHLDPCPAENGALRVLPGTHRLGRLSPADIARLRAEVSESVCACGRGDALLMRPLLLHASAASLLPGAHRRVLHIEYAPADLTLPVGIAWHETAAEAGAVCTNSRDSGPRAT